MLKSRQEPENASAGNEWEESWLQKCTTVKKKSATISNAEEDERYNCNYIK
jgi:hypothetical protein